MAKVQQLWRFPVKSMQGEPVGSFEISPRGVVGDRAWALIDAADGKVEKVGAFGHALRAAKIC